MSRGGDAINCGWCTLDCSFSEESSRKCELSNVKCELETMKCCFALKLAISPSQENLETISHPFGRLLRPLETMKCCFALKLSISPSQETLEAISHPFGRLLKPVGSRLEASWSGLRASRATLGVFGTVLRRLQEDNMVLAIKIHHFGGRFRLQDRGQTDVG